MRVRVRVDDRSRSEVSRGRNALSFLFDFSSIHYTDSGVGLLRGHGARKRVEGLNLL